MEEETMTDEQIYQALQFKIDALYKKIDAYKEAQKHLTVQPTVQPAKPAQTITKKPVAYINGAPKIGFEKWVSIELSDGVERGSREMLNKFNKQFNKNLSISTFSSKLSDLRKRGKIKKVDYPDEPLETRFKYTMP